MLSLCLSVPAPQFGALWPPSPTPCTPQKKPPSVSKRTVAQRLPPPDEGLGLRPPGPHQVKRPLSRFTHLPACPAHGSVFPQALEYSVCPLPHMLSSLSSLCPCPAPTCFASQFQPGPCVFLLLLRFSVPSPHMSLNPCSGPSMGTQPPSCFPPFPPTWQIHIR